MKRFNGLRVVVSVLGLCGMLWSVLVPWWAYRADADLGAVYAEWKDVEFATPGPTYWGNEVDMVPVWEIGKFEVREWLPFNLIQMAGIVCAWGWGLAVARNHDEAGTAVTVPVTKDCNSSPQSEMI